MLQAVLPLCPNKPSVFITFRPACPRALGLVALMLAGLKSKLHIKTDLLKTGLVVAEVYLAGTGCNLRVELRGPKYRVLKLIPCV